MWVSLAGPPGLAVHLVEHQHYKVPGLWCGGSQDRGVRHHILRFAKDVNPKAVQTWTWHARPSRKSISTWTSNIYIYTYIDIYIIYLHYILHIYIFIYIYPSWHIQIHWFQEPTNSTSSPVTPSICLCRCCQPLQQLQRHVPAQG